MKILADQNIPYVTDAFSSLGEVVTIDGGKIDNSSLKDIDILLVRSITLVNEELLKETNVKFVATATIGTDHIDQKYLKENSIGFASAPGSNANSVVEYVFAAIVYDLERKNETIEGKTLSIIGVGNIGSILYDKAKALGMNVLLNDPIKEDNGYYTFEKLETILPKADYVSIHVPLTYDGNWPTYGMINSNFLSLMPDNSVLINASRGKTNVELALLDHSKRLGSYILDVWPMEPNISTELHNCCQIATPHIAGYSFDGKCRGTEMIYNSACNYFFKPIEWSINDIMKSIDDVSINYNEYNSFNKILNKAYNIIEDDQKMREIIGESQDTQKEIFSSLRKNYQRRLEFSHFKIKGKVDKKNSDKLKELGFNL